MSTCVGNLGLWENILNSKISQCCSIYFEAAQNSITSLKEKKIAE
jgi:hypothetical protein